jgi:hypothetical protein
MRRSRCPVKADPGDEGSLIVDLNNWNLLRPIPGRSLCLLTAYYRFTAYSLALGPLSRDFAETGGVQSKIEEDGSIYGKSYCSILKGFNSVLVKIKLHRANAYSDSEPIMNFDSSNRSDE